MTVRRFDEALDLTDRHKQILTLLLLGATREELAEAIWSGADAKKQRNNLNVQLNTLRKIVEPWGIATHIFEDGLRRATSDVEDLRRALAAGDAHAVCELYVEPFAPGIDLAPVEEERRNLRADVVSLLYEASGDAPAAEGAGFLARVLELERLHEAALQRLLTILVEQGRRREARQRYDAFAESLAEEMGLGPLEKTERTMARGLSSGESVGA